MPTIYLTLILTFGILVLGLIWLWTLPPYVKSSRFTNKAPLLRLSLWAIMLVATIFLSVRYPMPPTELDSLLQIVGIILFICGAAIALWAKFTMREVWGMPGQHDKSQNKLITTGPFAFSRNPIYLGLMMLFVGFARAINSPGIAFIILYYWMISREVVKEEQLLQRHFGKQYTEYMQKVPRWLKTTL